MKRYMLSAMLLCPGAVAGAQAALTLVPDPAGECRSADVPSAGSAGGERSVALLLPSAERSRRRVLVTLDARGRPRAFRDEVVEPTQTVRVQIDPETGILTGDRVVMRSETPVRSQLNAVALDSARALTLEVVRRCGAGRGGAG